MTDNPDDSTRKRLTGVLCGRVFSGAIAAGGVVKVLRVPDGSSISNSRIKPKGDIAGAVPLAMLQSAISLTGCPGLQGKSKSSPCIIQKDNKQCKCPV